MKDLCTLTVYPGLKKLRLEFNDNSWPIIHTFEHTETCIECIKEMKETYDDFLIQDVQLNVSYRAGKKVK